MFDTSTIGRKIKQARIDLNMTQMNLADLMGVSYQAVSNWERGNSMPDISKLADLCAALHITVDELLGIAAPAVTKAMAQEELTIEELAEVAPVLPPKMIREQNNKKKQKLNLSRIADMAPFLDEEFLDQLIENAELSDLDGLDELLPFLSREKVEKLADRVNVDDLDMIAEIAPFFSKSALDKIVRRCIESGNLDDIEELAPFLSKETLNCVVDAVIAGHAEVDMEELYPFLSKESLRRLAKHMMENQDLDDLEEMIPFL